LQIHTLFDSRALACFLDEEFAKYHNIPLVKKLRPIYEKAIDGRVLSSRDVNQKTKLQEVSFKGYKNTIMFNIIKIPSNPMILGPGLL